MACSKISYFTVENELTFKDWAEHCSFSMDGKYLAICSGHGVSVYKISRPKETEHIKLYREDGAELENVHLSHGSAESCVDRSPGRHTIEQIAYFEHEDCVWKCDFNLNGSLLCSVASDGKLYVWNIAEKILHCTLEAHSYHCVLGCAVFKTGAKHNEDELIVTCATDGLVKLWSLITQKKLITFYGHWSAVDDVKISNDGNFIASCSKDRTVRLWSMIDTFDESRTRRRPIRVFRGHNHWVLSCDFSSDDQLIVSTSTDKTVKIWSTKLGLALWTLGGHTGIVWSACFCGNSEDQDAIIASCASDKSLRFHDVISGQELQCISNPSKCDDGKGQLLSVCYNSITHQMALAAYSGWVGVGALKQVESIPNNGEQAVSNEGRHKRQNAVDASTCTDDE